MKLIVNGETHDHARDGAIVDLLQELGASADRTAVVVNDEVVPRGRWDSVRLSDGDRVELVTFAGGG